MDHKNDYIASFDEYLRQGEPSKRESATNWQTAIGLQAVDGLRPSSYLLEVASMNIEGCITLEESRELIDSYYRNKAARTPKEEEEEEADKVSANIARILKSQTFAFNTNGYISLHRRIFEGVFKHAGRLRNYDITKREWVLDGGTVNYLNWEDLRRAIDYDIEQEKSFSYKGLDKTAVVEHLARFVSGLWQIHAFCEGNTRTTAVFTIQYLRSMGYDVDNRLFAHHSWYFRNALVRANYRNVQKDIDYTPIYLVRFFQNLLYGDQWELKSRYLHIAPTDEWKHQPNLADDENDGVNGADGGINATNGGINGENGGINAISGGINGDNGGISGGTNTISGGVSSPNGGISGGKSTESGGINLLNGGINAAGDLLLATISDHPGLNAPTLAARLQMSLRTAQRHLKTLADAHRIEFRGARKTGGYWLVENT